MTNRLKIIVVMSLLSPSITFAMSDYIRNLLSRVENISLQAVALTGPISFQLARERALQENPSLGNSLNLESFVTFLIGSFALAERERRSRSVQRQEQDNQSTSGWWYTIPAVASGALSLAYLYYERRNQRSNHDNLFVFHSIATTIVLTQQGYQDYSMDRDRIESYVLEEDTFRIRPMERPALQYNPNGIVPFAPPAA